MTRIDEEEGTAGFHALLFDTNAPDRSLELEELGTLRPTSDQLLWVDMQSENANDVRHDLLAVARLLDLHGTEQAIHETRDGAPLVRNHDDWFLVQAVAVELSDDSRVHGIPLLLLCGPSMVVTAHAGALVFLEELRTREQADSRIGALQGDSFSASLLGWLLDGYLDAVSTFELEVDRLEVALLGNPRHRECLPELAALRRSASRLRLLLAPHRAVFGAMARPDFRPDADARAERHFRALEQRFERAVDATENARDLLVGTFELYSTRSAERTNDTMRMLTFATVLLGTLAVFAGMLGMNFQVAFFEAGAFGFWTAVAGMTGFAIVALLVARWRRWI